MWSLGPVLLQDDTPPINGNNVIDPVKWAWVTLLMKHPHKYRLINDSDKLMSLNYDYLWAEDF